MYEYSEFLRFNQRFRNRLRSGPQMKIQPADWSRTHRFSEKSSAAYKTVQEQLKYSVESKDERNHQNSKILGSQVTVIPSLEQDSVNAQAERLSEYLASREVRNS